MAAYNITRYVEQLLEKTESLPPSFTVHLHVEYWVLNNGSKFLYHNQIASLLDDIRAHRIPVDFLDLFDSARVPFYDGCMVVELLDYRPQKSSEPALKNPEKTRVVLHPSPETLWADICSLNQRNGGKWTDVDALEVEAKLLLATSQPLCLDPDPHLTRVVNNVLRVSTPSIPLSLKRKASAMAPEEDGPEKAKRERILGFMAPRDNRLHAPSYRLLDAIEANRQRKEVAKASGTVQHGNQYMPANSQSVQPVPPQLQPSPVPQVHSSVAVHPQEVDAQKTPKVELPQTFHVAFRQNGAHTPIPPQPTHQFINQHPPTAPQGSAAQPQVYANLQAAHDATDNRVPTPTQQPQIQPSQIQHYQHYVQQYQFQPQQSLQQHQTTTQTLQLSRPPSQPQHPQAQNTSIQPRLSPNPPTQLSSSQQMPPQRFVQTPKPLQVQPTQTPQQYSGNTTTFQGSVPNTHFLQPPGVGVRPAQKGQPGSVQDPQLTLPANATQAQVAHAQQFYNQQLQQYNQSHQSQGQGQQPGSQRLNPLLQRMAQSISSSGGRTTPGQAQQSPGLQPQQLHQGRTVTATPSPVKGSPVFNQTAVGAGGAVRASPMQAKAQVPIQQAGSGQQHQVPVLGQHTQPAQQLQGQQLPNSGGMQAAPQRIQFQPQYSPSHLRPLVHGNPQIAPASLTPTIAHASPVVGGRPITPAINADIKPQPPQAGPGQQLPLRRPTPLQQQATVAQMTQMQAHAQKQQQTPQTQVQQLPQAQGQPGQVPTTPTPPQVQQTPVPQAAQIPNAQQMAAYPFYEYQMQQFWRVAQQQQQLQQGQGPGNPAVAPHSQQQGTSMTPQQQAAALHQHHLQTALIQQFTQQAQALGQRLSPAQIQAIVQQKLLHQAHALAQAQAQASGQHQAQGAQQPQQVGQQAQITPARAQALMMGKMQMQVGSQMYGQQSLMQGAGVGQGQSANMTPAQMHQMQQQAVAAAAQAQAAQQAGQKGKPAAGLPKKGPTR